MGAKGLGEAGLERSAGGEPDAVEGEVGFLVEEVVVAVVMEDPELVDVGD